jgi:dTDP-4-dehydrorhamnose 3,5-epimerase
VLIPEGFAHGFQTMRNNCELLYFHTAAWRPASGGGLNPRDERLSIKWPAPITKMSPRDEAHPLLSEDFAGIVL